MWRDTEVCLSSERPVANQGTSMVVVQRSVVRDLEFRRAAEDKRSRNRAEQ